MARKSRNYKAEYERRQALARARGFKSLGAQRRAIQTGKAPAIAPHRLRSRKTINAQAQMGGLKYNELVSAVSIEQRCRDWSAGYAKTPMCKYVPRDAKRLGLTKDEYTRLYFEAFVSGPTAYHKARYKGGSAPMRRWFVDVHHYYEAGEYDERYPVG